MAQFLILTTCLIFLGPPFPYLCDGISNSVIELLQGLESWQLMSAAAAKSLQSCPTLCDPIDGSPPGSPVPGILQARTLEWVAISFSDAWKWSCSVMSDLATPWTAAYQAPPSMGFSRQEYWSGVPLPSPLISLTYFLFFLLVVGLRFCCCGDGGCSILPPRVSHSVVLMFTLKISAQ